MKLTVLVDNNTIIDQYFCGEPGVAYFLECEDKKYLFDTGYSDLFLRNAVKLGIDLAAIDGVIISHGHNDHTWGLGELVRFYTEGKAAGRTAKFPRIIAHPDAFLEKRVNGLTIGSLVSDIRLKHIFPPTLSKTPVQLAERLIFLGEIERTNSFEAQQPIGETFKDGIWQDDFVADDSALVYQSDQGLVIITGCSHSGICNIIEYAKKIGHDDRICAVIGGFHLLNPSLEQLQSTKEYLKQQKIGTVFAGHCTDLHSKIALAEAVNLKEVGTGLVVKW